MVRHTVKIYGGIDILVNNAGRYKSIPLVDITTDDWDMTFNINIRGTFYCTREVAKIMIEQKRGGSVINISSTASFRPNVVGMSHYHSSKGAQLSFTNHICGELSPYGIRVNAVCPGSVDVNAGTDTSSNIPPEIVAKINAKIPLGRQGTPDDIGRAVLYLASDMSSYVTGLHLVVDCGMIKVPTMW
jgi:2-deoxy-D-gluconate 3-dehydrogenase